MMQCDAMSCYVMLYYRYDTLRYGWMKTTNFHSQIYAWLLAVISIVFSLDALRFAFFPRSDSAWVGCHRLGFSNSNSKRFYLSVINASKIRTGPLAQCRVNKLGLSRRFRAWTQKLDNCSREDAQRVLFMCMIARFCIHRAESMQDRFRGKGFMAALLYALLSIACTVLRVLVVAKSTSRNFGQSVRRALLHISSM